MAVVPSTMLALGTEAPAFNLPDAVTGKNITLASKKGTMATVIMFICNHCPFVKHIQLELVALANDYLPKGIEFIAINANDVENYPQDSPENMKQTAEVFDYPFPYLFDESQAVARAYQAACTPDMYVFDKDLQLVYRGQIDDSRPGNKIPVTGKDLRNALDAVINGEPVDENQIPSIGCNIKWK